MVRRLSCLIGQRCSVTQNLMLTLCPLDQNIIRCCWCRVVTWQDLLYPTVRKSGVKWSSLFGLDLQLKGVVSCDRCFLGNGNWYGLCPFKPLDSMTLFSFFFFPLFFKLKFKGTICILFDFLVIFCFFFFLIKIFFNYSKFEILTLRNCDSSF
jgi:hypothetical protein